MKEYRYYYHGLNVSSELALPEWTAFETPVSETTPDVLITLTANSDGNPSFLSEAPEQGEYRFFAKDAGWFRVRQGREIAIFAERLLASRRLRAFLTGSAWGALLYQRELLLAHASAIQAGESAVLFCGRRGQGKSTLAAFLTERNYKLVSDDLCCMRLAETGPPLVYPSVPRFKLWSDSIRELGWVRGEMEQPPPATGKLHIFRQTPQVVDPLPVRSIYLLNWGQAGFERLSGFAGLNRLFNASTWRGDLLLAAGNPSEYFRRCAQLAGRVPIWDFRRPRDFSAAEASLDSLVRHVEESKIDSGK